MSRKCNECGKNTLTDGLTHCSNRCLFADIKDSKSIDGIPIETWDKVEQPIWI